MGVPHLVSTVTIQPGAQSPGIDLSSFASVLIVQTSPGTIEPWEVVQFIDTTLAVAAGGLYAAGGACIWQMVGGAIQITNTSGVPITLGVYGVPRSAALVSSAVVGWSPEPATLTFPGTALALNQVISFTSGANEVGPPQGPLYASLRISGTVVTGRFSAVTLSGLIYPIIDTSLFHTSTDGARRWYGPIALPANVDFLTFTCDAAGTASATALLTPAY